MITSNELKMQTLVIALDSDHWGMKCQLSQIFNGQFIGNTQMEPLFTLKFISPFAISMVNFMFKVWKYLLISRLPYNEWQRKIVIVACLVRWIEYCTLYVILLDDLDTIYLIFVQCLLLFQTNKFNYTTKAAETTCAYFEWIL